MKKFELHQLDLRYEALRSRSPSRERQLVASIAEIGQQIPIVVVVSDGQRVVIDGYKRIRALKRLAQDVVGVTVWEIAEPDALLLERMMRTTPTEGALEQGWVLRELAGRFGLSLDELARRFDKTKSWVSRRLALVEQLPPEVQERVRTGDFGAHAAMRYFVPLARANAESAVKLALAIAPLKPTTRQVAELCAGYASGPVNRELILRSPQVFLSAQEEARRSAERERSPAQQLVDDLAALSGAARRARRRLQQGLWQHLLDAERSEAKRGFLQAQGDSQALFERLTKETTDARPGDTCGDSATA